MQKPSQDIIDQAVSLLVASIEADCALILNISDETIAKAVELNKQWEDFLDAHPYFKEYINNAWREEEL